MRRTIGIAGVLVLMLAGCSSSGGESGDIDHNLCCLVHAHYDFGIVADLAA